jgi:regulator of PEP synthase PpsR (kinase-PPPase family)
MQERDRGSQAGVAKPQVFVVSGGMGASGEQLARTAMAQFEHGELPIVVVPQVRTAEDLTRVVDRAASVGGVVVHTLVDPVLRAELIETARARGVVELDVMGPVLDALAGLLGEAPLGRPGLYREVREDYFRRIEAIEYAVRHDDGRHCNELGEADIVLTGISRTGKTPLSMYLAMRGYKTANVPLVKGLEAPRELFEVEAGKVVGLMIEPGPLVERRRRRQQHLGGAGLGAYAAPREVFEELEQAREVFQRGRFAVIDATLKPIEESASEVVAVVARRTGLEVWSRSPF